MGAMTLLVDHRDAELKLSSDGNVFCLRYPDNNEHRVGIYAVGRIVVHGEAKLSAAVLRACDKANVSLVILHDFRLLNGLD